MSGRHVIQGESGPESKIAEERSLLRSLIETTAGPIASPLPPINGVVIGELVALKDGGRTPLIVFEGQPGAEPVPARSVVDLHGAHIGRQVVVLCESGYPTRPIVMGVLRGREGWPFGERPGTLEVDADGERLVVSAKQELVVRCGKASITLGRDGRVTIRGTHVVSHAEGVNRMRGGSVQLN